MGPQIYQKYTKKMKNVKTPPKFPFGGGPRNRFFMKPWCEPIKLCIDCDSDFRKGSHGSPGSQIKFFGVRTSDAWAQALAYVLITCVSFCMGFVYVFLYLLYKYFWNGRPWGPMCPNFPLFDWLNMFVDWLRICLIDRVFVWSHVGSIDCVIWLIDLS